MPDLLSTPVAGAEPVPFARHQASEAIRNVFTTPPPRVSNVVQDPGLIAPSAPAVTRTVEDAGAAAQAAAQVKPAGVPPGPPPPPPPDKANVMTPGRRAALQQSATILRDVTIGKGTADHPWALAGISQTTDGALAVADSLELAVSQSPKNLMKFMDTISRSQDSTRGFSYALANAAHVAPERVAGILLLTTDAEGGKDSLANLLGKMSQDQPGSQNLGTILESSSRTPTAARGMVELLDVLTQPEGDRWDGATNLATSLSRTTEYVHGSRHVAQMFLNTMEAEGGARNFASNLSRMSRTPESAQATRDMLLNMSYDREGSRAVGTMLARASSSRGGGTELLDGLTRMAAGPTGQRDVGRLFNRMAQVPEGARFLSNLFKEPAHADRLTDLIRHVGASDEGRYFLNSAFESIDGNRRTIADSEIIKGRLASNPELAQAVEKVWTGEPDKPPTLDVATYQNAVAAEAALLAAPQDKLELVTPPQPAEPETAQSEPEAEPEPETTASEPLPLPTVEARAADRLETLRESVRESNETRATRETNEAQGTARAREAQQSERTERAQSEDRSYSFRPADVYSEETLRQLRICGECGFRTTSAGLCPRCAAAHRN